MSENSTPQKKRRFYHNLMDAYRIAARTYPWIGWLMIGVTVVATALGVLAAALIHGSWFSLILLGLLIGVLISTIILSTLTERATYAQVEGTVGQVYMVISRIRSGWIANQQPIAANPSRISFGVLSAVLASCSFPKAPAPVFAPYLSRNARRRSESCVTSPSPPFRLVPKRDRFA